MVLVGSVDGRITRCQVFDRNMNYVLNSELIFKAHKKEKGSRTSKISLQYSINSLLFTNRDNVKNGKSFISCGTDSDLYIWDYEKKHKSLNIRYNDTQMASKAAVNLDGTVMVFALGYDWHKGIWGIGDRPGIDLRGWMIENKDCAAGSRYGSLR